MKKISLYLTSLLLFSCTVFAQPSGTIIAFGGPESKIPDGWVICDGKLLDYTNPKYVNLFRAIGVSWGGDGANQFAVPDLRGQFLRGVSNNTGIDPEAGKRNKSRPDLSSSGNGGNAVGSKQGNQVGPHSHSLKNIGFRNSNLSGGHKDWMGAEFTQYDAGPPQQLKDINTLILVEDNTGTESRPTNAYVYYLIKL